MIDTDLVWARDPHEGYIQGKIEELGAHEYDILPIDKSLKKRSCPIGDVFPSCDAKSDNDDNCKWRRQLKLLILTTRKLLKTRFNASHFWNVFLTSRHKFIFQSQFIFSKIIAKNALKKIRENVARINLLCSQVKANLEFVSIAIMQFHVDDDSLYFVNCHAW